MASHNAPAAGASGGRAPLQAVYHAPRFINHEQGRCTSVQQPARSAVHPDLHAGAGVYVYQTASLGSYALLMGLHHLGRTWRTPRRAIYADGAPCCERPGSQGLLRRGTKIWSMGSFDYGFLGRRKPSSKPLRTEIEQGIFIGKKPI